MIPMTQLGMLIVADQESAEPRPLNRASPADGNRRDGEDGPDGDPDPATQQSHAARRAVEETGRPLACIRDRAESAFQLLAGKRVRAVAIERHEQAAPRHHLVGENLG